MGFRIELYIFLYSNYIILLLFYSNLSLYCYFGRDCPCVRILFKIVLLFCWKNCQASALFDFPSFMLYWKDFFVLSGSLITLSLCSIPLSITMDNIQSPIGIQKKNIQFAGWILSHYTVTWEFDWGIKAPTLAVFMLSFIRPSQ